MQSSRIEVTCAGGPEVLSLRPWTVPALRPDEVLVKVTHAGVSFGDIMLRRHVFRHVPSPAVPGYDVVGIVIDANGRNDLHGVTVAAFIEYGGYAEHAIVPMHSLVRIPAGVDPVAASAVVLNYATAAAMLDLANCAAGDPVLIHGMRGGVGTALEDLARLRQLPVIGTGRSQLSNDVPLLDRTAADFEAKVRSKFPQGMAAVFDGNASALAQSHSLLRRGGTLVVFGLSSVAGSTLMHRLRFADALLTLLRLKICRGGKRAKVFAIDKLFRRHPLKVRDLIAEQLALLQNGLISPKVGLVLPLTQAFRAHALLEQGEVHGKVVLSTGDHRVFHAHASRVA